MNNDSTTTKPTIETVLERVNELGGQINNQLTELRAGQVQLQSEVAELRNDIGDIRTGQRKLRSQFEILNDTLLSIRADMRDDRRDYDRRLEKLESPQS